MPIHTSPIYIKKAGRQIMRKIPYSSFSKQGPRIFTWFALTNNPNGSGQLFSYPGHRFMKLLLLRKVGIIQFERIIRLF